MFCSRRDCESGEVFTGLIQDLGSVESIEQTEAGARLRVATGLGADIAVGDSVAVDGVCLTATAVGEGSFDADAVRQTLEVTALGEREPGDRVNLELAMRAGDRLGGHIVQGHVDATAEVVSVEPEGFGKRIRIAVGEEIAPFVVERGSITLGGTSLTVAELGEGWLEVALIPETLERTTLGAAAPGRKLNVEVDVLAKYVQRAVSPFLRPE